MLSLQEYLKENYYLRNLYYNDELIIEKLRELNNTKHANIRKYKSSVNIQNIKIDEIESLVSK